MKRIIILSTVLISLVILAPLGFAYWYCHGMNEAQYSGKVYACIDMKIEYGHIDPDDLENVITSSNEITSRLLKFSTKSAYTSFDKLSFDKETPTHCVYYAKVYKQIFDYIISKGNLHATCTIKREPIKGLGFIPAFFKAINNQRMYNFTKDHDYCLINNEIKVDPTFHDFFF